MKKFTVFILFLLFLTSNCFSKSNEDKNSFFKKNKDDNWYFLVGTGFSGSIYSSNITKTRASTGLHLSTSVGYYANNSYAIEVGSITSFNEFDSISMEGFSTQENQAELIAWNTAFFWGVKVRFPGIRSSNLFSPFIKVFYGYGVSVAFLENLSDKNKEMEKYRMHQEGPLFGVSISNIFNTYKKHKGVWFIEFTLIRQIYWNRYAVNKTGTVATIEKSEPTHNNDYSIQGHISVGMNLF